MIEALKKDSAMTSEQLLTQKETACLLGLTNHHTLAVWRSNKSHPELEYVKVGRLVRYQREAVERFIESRTIR
jgi:excisionase family DNA binding protein